MLTIKKDFNFDEFEKELVAVKKETFLRLPNQVRHIGLWGVEAALIQLLITWSRSHDTPTIKSFINDEDPDKFRNKQLEDLGKRLYGIAALYLTDKVTTAQDAIIEKIEYAMHCKETLVNMDECDIFSPQSVNATYPKNRNKVAAQFICLHHTKHEFQGALYDGKSRNSLIERSSFRSLIKSALGENKQFYNHINKSPRFLDSIASLVYELFQNTNDHAYEDLDGSSFKKNLRALSIKSHSNLSEHTDSDTMKSTNARFNDYVDYCSAEFKSHNLDIQRYLEISVVDGGLGLAQQFSGKSLTEITAEEEISTTVECFKAGVSSKSSISRGEGLDQVWAALCNLNGFFRLRTGRQNLFQTLHDKSPTDKRTLSKWSDGMLEHAEGTAVTIIIPCIF